MSPADVECEVEGCTYTNRPTATSWIYHHISKHGATFTESEDVGLVIPDSSHHNDPWVCAEQGCASCQEETRG